LGPTKNIKKLFHQQYSFSLTVKGSDNRLKQERKKVVTIKKKEKDSHLKKERKRSLLR
jgi:phosphate starvation-inducible protein PhoH